MSPEPLACVAGVWKERERGFWVRGRLEGRAPKTPFPFPFKRLPRRLQSLLVLVLRRRGGSGDENDFSPARSSFLTSLRNRISNKPRTWSDFSVAGWLSWQQWFPTLRRAMGMDKITEQQNLFFSSWKDVILSSLQNRKITRSRLRNGALVLALTQNPLRSPRFPKTKKGRDHATAINAVELTWATMACN